MDSPFLANKIASFLFGYKWPGQVRGYSLSNCRQTCWKWCWIHVHTAVSTRHQYEWWSMSNNAKSQFSLLFSKARTRPTPASRKQMYLLLWTEATFVPSKIQIRHRSTSHHCLACKWSYPNSESQAVAHFKILTAMDTNIYCFMTIPIHRHIFVK